MKPKSDIEVVGMAPVIYEFMGKQRKLRNLTINEDIDLEVVTVELNNLPVPELRRSRVNDEGEEEEIPLEEAVATFKGEIERFKLDTFKLREKYLLMLFDEDQITPEEIKQVTTREWGNLRKKLNRQRYYDMGLTDMEIDELEKQSVKAGFQNTELLKNLE